MAKNQKIQYINPTDLTLLIYDGKHFRDSDKQEKIYTVSRVLYEDVVVYSFKIPSGQASDDLSSIVEIKMYEDAGLDVNKSYKITYLVKKLDYDEMCLVESFAVDLETLKETYGNCIKKVKYIDFLALPFFSYTTLYANKILTPKNDIFVYIGNDEAFISFYKNGSYISTKYMINLKDIVEKLDSQELHINIEDLNDILLNKGLKEDLYERHESQLFLELETIFSDILTKINNVALHNRSVFGFEKTDRLFFSTKYGRIKGLKDFVLNFGFTDVEILDFNLFREKQKSDFLDKIVCSYGFDKFKENSNKQNVTIFDRPPTFFSTQFGKLSLWIMLFVAIFAGVYAFFYLDIQNLQEQKNSLERKYQSIQQRAKKYKAETRKKIQEIKKTKELMQKQKVIFDNIKQSISKLEKMKNRDNSYVNFMAKVDLLLQKYQLRTKSIEQIGNRTMIIEVISGYNERDKIAKFLKSLINEGFVNVKTDEIRLDKTRYISKIEIEHE